MSDDANKPRLTDSPPTRFTPVLRALVEARADFVLVGGLAVIAQGYFRTTLDTDLVVSLTPENLDLVLEAIASVGYVPRLPVAARDFADADKRRDWIENRNMTVFTFVGPRGKDPLVDLFPQYPLPWNQLRGEASILDVGGVAIPVCSVRHLIDLKRVAGRARDEQDIAMLLQAHPEAAR